MIPAAIRYVWKPANPRTDQIEIKQTNASTMLPNGVRKMGKGYLAGLFFSASKNPPCSVVTSTSVVILQAKTNIDNIHVETKKR